MSSSPDTHRSALVSPYTNHSPYPHHQHTYLPPPSAQFRLPPIRTLSLPETQGPPSSTNDSHHQPDPWNRSSISGTPAPAARPGSAIASDSATPISHSPYSHRASFSNNPPPLSSSAYNGQSSSYPQQSPIPPSTPQQQTYNIGQKRPHPSSARQPLPTPPPTSNPYPHSSQPPPQQQPPPTHQQAVGSGGYYAHHHAAERSVVPYPTHPPAQAPPPPPTHNGYYQHLHHHHQQQYAPYPSPATAGGAAPVATQYNPDPYGRAPPPPPTASYGYPPAPPAPQQYPPPPTDYSQQPPYGAWPPQQQQPPPQHHYHQPPYATQPPPPPQQQPQYGAPVMHVAAPGPAPGPVSSAPIAQQSTSSGWTPIAPAPAPPPAPVNRPPPTSAGPDKPLAQVLEHCQAIMAFANYYASRQHQPSHQETREMVSRAEAVVQILFQLAEDAKPHRKALADEITNAAPKKRKLSSGEALLTDRTNGVKGEEKEFGMSREAKLKFFGDNKEAMEQAEKDMRTITQKRTLSQGGVLPSSKTKYKKRSRATPPGRCHSCFSTETPEWRRGPDGARTLCNACGLHYAKMMKRQGGGPGGTMSVTIPMLQASAQKNGIGAPPPKGLGEPGPSTAGDAHSTSSTVIAASHGTKEEEDVGGLPRDESDDEGSEEGSEIDEDDEDDVRYTHERPPSRQEDRRQEDSRPPSPVKPMGSPHPQSYRYPSPRPTTNYAAPPPAPYASYSDSSSHHRHSSSMGSDAWGASAARQASSHVRAS